MTPFWITAFLDFRAGHHDAGLEFWKAATAYDLSSARGDQDEFASLVPPDGDPHLAVQRLSEGDDRIHLDLHVEDPQRAAERAVAAGATFIADLGFVVMHSPASLPFCFVGKAESRRPTPTTWPDGHTSMLDQVCLDIPADAFETESAFWAEITGWESRTSAISDDFSPLRRPPDQAVRILRQRLDEPSGPARAHLDWATNDRAAETARHVALGAHLVEQFEWWTVLSDPTGRAYCITERDPATGLLPTSRP